MHPRFKAGLGLHSGKTVPFFQRCAYIPMASTCSLYQATDRSKMLLVFWNSNLHLTQSGREKGIQRLMNISLLKRLESSVYSFRLTLTRIKQLIEETIAKIDNYNPDTEIDSLAELKVSENDLDADDENNDLFTVGRKVKIALSDMDYVSWRQELTADLEVLELLIAMVSDITPQYDNKLQILSLVGEKIENPINGSNKKLFIFTAFADTAQYLYDNISDYVKNRYGLNTAMITGTIDGRTTIPRMKADFNTVLTAFSPLSKIGHSIEHTIDVLIGTDCISEGQNLQDCDYCVNYDIQLNIPC
jgi:hypothetical protein